MKVDLIGEFSTNVSNKKNDMYLRTISKSQGKHKKVGSAILAITIDMISFENTTLEARALLWKSPFNE